MNAPLPAWAAQSEEACLRLANIVASPPETRIKRDGIGGVDEEYVGKDAARLRRIYMDWFNAEFRHLDAMFAITQLWDEEAALAIHRVEDANALMHRVLVEGLPAERLAA